MVGIIGAWYFGPKVTYAKKFKALRALNFFALKAWLGYGWGMAGPKVTSAKKFKALRALNFFALKVLPGHGWGIAGVWLGPSPINFSTPCLLGGRRVYEPPHMLFFLFPILGFFGDPLVGFSELSIYLPSCEPSA